MTYKRELIDVLGEYRVCSTNEHLLSLLLTAPESQISGELKERCEDFFQKVKEKKVTPEELRDFLIDDVYMSCCATSTFIKAMISPNYVSSEAYMNLKKS